MRTRFPFIVSQVFLVLFLVSFLASFSVSLSVSFSLRSWTAPRRFRSPTWPQLGPILEPCWSDFGAFLGVVLLSSFKIHWEAIFDRFFIDFRPLGGTKNIEKTMVFQHFCFSSLFALETDSGPILGRFWSPKSTQNRSRIGLHS